ncbi:hypothetical protein STEG23_004548, partial [Scotinomys teguina]
MCSAAYRRVKTMKVYPVFFDSRETYSQTFPGSHSYFGFMTEKLIHFTLTYNPCSQALINLLGASPGTPSNSYGAKDLLRRQKAAPTAAPLLWYNADTAGIICEANIMRSFFHLHLLNCGANGKSFLNIFGADVLLFMCRAAEQRALEIRQRTKTSLPTYLITAKYPSVATSSKSTSAATVTQSHSSKTSPKGPYYILQFSKDLLNCSSVPATVLRPAKSEVDRKNMLFR